MTLQFNLGTCTACITNGAALDASRVCSNCLTDLDRLCLSCADGTCPQCGGRLAQRNAVFPYTLFSAIEQGDLDKIRDLYYTSGQDINAVRDRNGLSPLSFAVRSTEVHVKRRIDVVNCLLSLGALPTASDSSDRTPLIHVSMSRGLTSALAELLASSVNCQDGMGKTALMYAAEGPIAVNGRGGNLTVTRLLLEQGADALIQCRFGLTALGYALRANRRGGNEDMVHYLEKEMLRQAAERVFEKRYKATFNTNGSINVVDNNGAIVALD